MLYEKASSLSFAVAPAVLAKKAAGSNVSASIAT
jgi:hypothetical protein